MTMKKPTITFNAFSFLQKRLSELGFPHSDEAFAIRNGETVLDLLLRLGLGEDEVEGAFVNGRIHPLETSLKDGDRVALIPPGTPGPHRFLLGIRKSG